MKVLTRRKLSILVLGIVLWLFSLIVIVSFGRSYTLRFDEFTGVDNIDEVMVEVSSAEEAEGESEVGDAIVEIVNKRIVDDKVEVEIKSVNRGKVFVDVTVGEETRLAVVYAHNLGVITVGDFLGDVRGDVVVPICTTIFLAYVLYVAIKTYREQIKKNLYRYENITRLGLVIMLGFATLAQAFTIFDYHGPVQTINDITGLFNIFSMVTLPLFFILSVGLTIAGVIMVKREGFNWKNFLGVMMGVSLCLATLLPELVNVFLQQATFVDVHNEQGVALYVQRFVESAVFMSLTYVEYILISTVFVTILAARRVPKPDKDYLLILGCYVNPDGTPGGVLKGRIDRAVEFRKMQAEQTGKNLVLVPSGGQGADEVISEAEAMKKYLIRRGVNEKDILTEDKSVNTRENIKFSDVLIRKRTKRAKVAFATTSYHVFRAGVIASDLGLHFEGVGAKTRTCFWINAFAREFLAEMVVERKRHTLAVALLWLMAFLSMGTVYLAMVIV